MDLKGARVAYFPNNPSLEAPSDRRRFVHYARNRGIPFETIGIKSREKYDVVVLNQKADLSQWSRVARGETKIIYDAVDSYVAQDATTFKGMMRGTWKYFTGQSRRLQFNYQKAVLEMCGRADAVICSTEAQKAAIRRMCGNVHLILDCQDNDVLDAKADYSRGQTFNFVWEGLASSGLPLEMLQEILEPISKRGPIAVHMLTDLVFYRYGDVFYRCDTAEEIRRRCGGFSRHIYLYKWNSFALSRLAAGSDLALIPLNLENVLQRGKPENKLLYFWRLGVPTITSATPAYDAAMERAGLGMTCRTVADWREMIERFMDDQSARQDAGRRGMELSRSYYSESQMLKRWDEAFDSLWKADGEILNPGPGTRTSTPIEGMAG